MSDSWCRPIKAENGTKVSGGAARNVRIKAGGGMDEIIRNAAGIAARFALEAVNEAVNAKNKRPLKLLVNKYG